MIRSQHPEHDDLVWNQNVDNAIILMSLLVTRSMFKRFRAPKRIRSQVLMRLDSLIQRFRSPVGTPAKATHDCA